MNETLFGMAMGSLISGILGKMQIINLSPEQQLITSGLLFTTVLLLAVIKPAPTSKHHS